MLEPARINVRIRHLAASLLSLALLALILTKSPEPNFSLADTTLTNAEAQTEREKARISDWATSTLQNEPLNARAFEALGLLAARDGDTKSADRLMKAAARRSLRQRIAVYWMMQSRFAAKDYAAAAGYADALLRGRPQAMPFAISVLSSMAELPNSEEILGKILTQNPPWRSLFFLSLKGHIRNPQAPLKLLLALKATPHPPTTQEIGAYLRLLTDNHLYSLSYYSWLQFLNPEQLKSGGLIVNGDFELTPSGLPYDWTIESGDGAMLEIAPRENRAAGHALLLELGPGRVDFHPVSELLALPPGHYRLSGSFKGNIRGRRGLTWTIECLPTRRTLAKTDMFLGDIQRWTGFSSRWEVPAECEAQTLKLVLDARSTSETMISGTAWFDDLAITQD
jgi:hypothetical protein